MIAVLAAQSARHVDERAVYQRPVIFGQIDQSRVGDQAAQLDQLPGALAPLHLPIARVMPRPAQLESGAEN